MIKYKKMLLLSVSGLLLCHQPSWSQTIHMADTHLSKSAQVAEPAFKQADYAISNDCMASQKDPVSAMAMNMIPFGIGSYQQGDIVGGVTLSTIDGLGLGILGLAAYGFMSGQSWGAAFITPGGLALVTLGRLLGLIFPWMHLLYIHNVTCAPNSKIQSSSHDQNPTGSMQILSYSASF